MRTEHQFSGWRIAETSCPDCESLDVRVSGKDVYAGIETFTAPFGQPLTSDECDAFLMAAFGGVDSAARWLAVDEELFS